MQAFLASAPDPVLVCDGGEFGQWAQAFCEAPARIINVPRAAHSTPPVELLVPAIPVSQHCVWLMITRGKPELVDRDAASKTIAVCDSAASPIPSSSIPSASHCQAATHLVAQSLNIRLGQLLAAHQALDPAVEGGDGGGLEVENGGRIGGCAPDILHIGVHGGFSGYRGDC